MLLKQWIRENDGFLRLDQFMSRALYEPKSGYYTKGIQTVGPGGDFSTSATLGKSLGCALARWAAEKKKELFPGFRWHLIELGGGSGSLALSVLKNFSFPLRWGCSFHEVEISAPLRDLQRRRLKRFGVQWHEKIESALAASNGSGIIFANEFLDAFPAQQFCYQQGCWRSVGLALHSSGEPVESFRDPERQEEKEALDFLNIREEWKKEGQRLEVQWPLASFIQNWSGLTKQGICCFIDYGDDGLEIPVRFPRGSLRGFFQHQIVEGDACFRRVGRQDLTVNVNFSHLRRWMENSGWEMVQYLTQKEFILSELGTSFQPTTVNECQLMDESGAGGAFKVGIFVKPASGNNQCR